MSAHKKSGHRLKVKIKTLSSTKMALAVVFFGVAALAFVAVGGYFGKTENDSGRAFCAYSSQVYNSGKGNKLANYCEVVQSAKECRDLFRGTAFSTNDECNSYLSSLSK